MNTSRPLLALVLLLLAGAAYAYEIQTHEKLSEVSFDASRLSKDSQLLQDLGLKTTDTFLNSKDPNPRTIKELISDGSRFEDSLLLARPIHHFYDPLRGDALFSFLAKPSPDWALEDKGQIIFPLFQGYSFADGRDSFYRALTATTLEDRNTYFGKTFEILGHVIHHVQDMAQPQHVRLDTHLKLSDPSQPDWFFENGSRYEQYTKDKGGNLPFAPYGPVSFDSARSFWHTGQGDGKGLAEYTNTNFVSAGTNFDDKSGRYASPAFDPDSAWEANANELFEQAGEGGKVPPECKAPNPPCTMTFYGTAVNDAYRPGASGVNPRTSTQSIFDQDLQAKNLKPVFSLNRFNFDAAHQFLIPRAVAYSTGLMDYFFRGKLEAQDAGFTDSGISLRVKNAIERSRT